MTYCVAYKINKDKIDDYINIHANCWDEQVIALRECGACNLEIYLNGEEVIITYDCIDFEEFLQKLARNSTNQKWQKIMDEMFADSIHLEGENQIKPLRKIFSLKKKYDAIEGKK